MNEPSIESVLAKENVAEAIIELNRLLAWADFNEFESKVISYRPEYITGICPECSFKRGQHSQECSKHDPKTCITCKGEWDDFTD